MDNDRPGYAMNFSVTLTGHCGVSICESLGSGRGTDATEFSKTFSTPEKYPGCETTAGHVLLCD